MPETLGKRKRRSDEARVIRKRRETESATDESDGSESGGPDQAALNAQEIFRRHFEAQFEALPDTRRVVGESGQISEQENEEEEEEAWDGISEEDSNGVLIVEHANTGFSTLDMKREELKAFMVQTMLMYLLRCANHYV